MGEKLETKTERQIRDIRVMKLLNGLNEEAFSQLDDKWVSLDSIEKRDAALTHQLQDIKSYFCLCYCRDEDNSQCAECKGTIRDGEYLNEETEKSCLCNHCLGKKAVEGVLVQLNSDAKEEKK